MGAFRTVKTLSMTVEHANQFYIDGRWRPCTTSASNSVVDPASEELVGEIAAGGPDDVDFAVAAARRAFPNFSRTSVEERVALLGRILELIQLSGTFELHQSLEDALADRDGDRP